MSTKPTAAMVANHFVFEVPGLISPHFHKCEGINRKTGEVFIVDGFTNIKHKFSSGLKEFGDITLTRTPDGSVDDVTMSALVDQCMNEGFRFDGHLIKYHNGQEAFRIVFLGMLVKEEQEPSLDTSSEERYDQKYICSVSEWVKIF